MALQQLVTTIAEAKVSYLGTSSLPCAGLVHACV
jgi:hypothetical protein